MAKGTRETETRRWGFILKHKLFGNQVFYFFLVAYLEMTFVRIAENPFTKRTSCARKKKNKKIKKN